MTDHIDKHVYNLMRVIFNVSFFTKHFPNITFIARISAVFTITSQNCWNVLEMKLIFFLTLEGHHQLLDIFASNMYTIFPYTPLKDEGMLL